MSSRVGVLRCALRCVSRAALVLSLPFSLVSFTNPSRFALWVIVVGGIVRTSSRALTVETSVETKQSTQGVGVSVVTALVTTPLVTLASAVARMRNDTEKTFLSLQVSLEFQHFSTSRGSRWA